MSALLFASKQADRVLTFLILLICLSFNFCPAQIEPPTPEKEQISGEIIIEGNFIQRLVLVNQNNKRETFNSPGERIHLPTGEYRLLEVILTNNYSGHFYPAGGYDWFMVTPDKPTRIKVGGPLKQKIYVNRRGRILMLSYQLVGIGNGTYVSANRDKPPRFTVYKVEKEIISGSFEYG